MDWTSIIASVVSAGLGITAIAVWLSKVMPKISGWIALAKDAVETVNDIAQALTPDDKGKIELTPEEVTKINADAIAFKTQLAILLGK